MPLASASVSLVKRFNEIMKDVTGISPKVLAQELRHLEQNELVVRKVYATTPVAIVNEAAAYSESLQGVLRALSEWGAGHRRKIIGK